LAFYHSASGQLTLTGINPDTSTDALSAVLTNLPPVASLELYYTDSTSNLRHSATFPVTNRTIAATMPANCVFTLVGFASAVGPPARISITPYNAVVAPSGTQQFTAVATDALGSVINPPPAFAWSVNGGGTINASGLFTAGGSAGGPFTITASSSGVSGTTSVSIATNLDLAPAGVGYTWHGMAASTGNSPQAAAPGINDGDINTDVSLLASAGEDISSAYEAAGVVWSAPQTINRVIYLNGSYNASHDGVFATNFGLQFSPNGTTWTNAGAPWTVAPAYTYNSAASADVSFTFTGGVATVLGVRCVGRVHTVETSQNSWVAFATELQAFAAPPLPPPVLTASVAYNGIAITWPALLTNYILEAATNLLPSATWSLVTNTPQATGDRRTVTVPTARGCQFFRLHQQ
jgi:hypothetical protein